MPLLQDIIDGIIHPSIETAGRVSDEKNKQTTMKEQQRPSTGSRPDVFSEKELTEATTESEPDHWPFFPPKLSQLMSSRTTC